MARDVSAGNEPVDPAAEFPEDVKQIYLTLKSRQTERLEVKARWVAVDAEGYAPDHELGYSELSLGPDQRRSASLRAPRTGFAPGDYRADLMVGGAVEQSLHFRITPLYPSAIPIERASLPASFNLASSFLGGTVESWTSEYSKKWAAANLIDGGESAWCSADSSVPQEVVFSFYQGREAQISAIVVDTRTSETSDKPDRSAKFVEVWTSTANAPDAFTKLTVARLRQPPSEQAIKLPPTRARYVKLRFTANYGGSYTQAGEVKILEAPQSPSILADMPKNIARRESGGAIVRFTSQYSKSYSAAYLIDGSVETTGWRSEKNAAFPQDIVFAFRGDRPALVERIVLNPKTEDRPETWVKGFTVAISTETPLDGFVEVGQFTLAQEPRDQSFPIGKTARFVRLRILGNHGGSTTTLGEVQIIEGSAAGYKSVLMDYGEATVARGGSSSAAAAPVLTDADAEKEPNNTPDAANPLTFGRWLKGVIDPLGEQDHFKVSVPGAGLQALTLDLRGEPYLRTSLALLDPTVKAIKQFDPGKKPAQERTITWAVPPGDYTLRVTEPPVSIVLIWDTSGSMQGSERDLEEAVLAMLDSVRPTERLNLMRFSSDVEPLLPEFTSERDRLKTVAAGKFSPGGFTSFYDAVAKGIQLLEPVAGNRAIVVMTDGADTNSKMSYPEFWRLLDERRIRLYTIGLGGDLLKASDAIATLPVRLLGHIAMATNGRFFFASKSEELKGVYRQIADELHAIATYSIKATVGQGPGSLAVAATGERLAAVSAPSQIELILDASGSMKQRVEGRPRIDVAKEVMVQIIKDLPDDVQVALRIYGHRIREGRPGDCKDSELVFPFGKIDKPKMIARVRAIQALGTTPIDYSLRQVAKDFGQAPGEKMVILVTDGKEECKGDPAAAVSELLAKGLKVRLNIVGFALADAATKRDMERVAKLTGGMFFDAANAKALTQAIRQSLAVPYDVLDDAGARVVGGLTGQDKVSIPEGVYTVVVRAADRPITIADVRVAPGGFTKVVLKKEGREIGIQILGP